MHKKAFSLVELAIVLVIIGILAGMVMKGKSLIESAKYRKELSIVRNIEIALNVYFVDHDKIPRIETGPEGATVNIKELIDAKVLTLDTLRSTFPDINGSVNHLVFHFSTDYPSVVSGLLVNSVTTKNTLPSLLYARFLTEDNADTLSGTMFYSRMPAKMVCSIERIIDDGFASNLGSHRFYLTPTDITTTYEVCMSGSMHTSFYLLNY